MKKRNFLFRISIVIFSCSHIGFILSILLSFVIDMVQWLVIHGDGSQSRDFTYIDNVIQANELAATTKNPDALNQVYNVACGDQSFLKELVENLRDLLSDFDSEIKNIEIKNGPERIGDIKHSLASIEKAKKLLNYQPQYSLQDGLKEAVKWYWENL